MNELAKKLRDTGTLDFSECKTLLEDVYNTLSSKKVSKSAYSQCLEVICRVAESRVEDILIKAILKECIYKSRVFLYEDTLCRKYGEDYFSKIDNSPLEPLAKSLYTLDNETVLTKDQKHLLDLFRDNNRIVVSAPTSFGKTRIIQEIISENNFKNILVVVPTLALSNELYISLREVQYLREKYDIIKTTKGFKGERNTIFLYTPEKTLVFLDERSDVCIDFFVMDEIYKISHEDDRKKTFTACLYELAFKKKIPHFYLIGPYFNKFSEAFLSQANAKFHRYEASIVSINTNLEDNPQQDFGKRKQQIINLLKEHDSDQSLIYCGNKQRITSLAKDIAKSDVSVEDNYIDREFIDYIKEEIHPDWILAQTLERGVAFHFSDMPNYVKNEIVSSFNEKKIKLIICSTTITEGVNTSAKRVIIFDNYKGVKEEKLTPFEVKNIKGRAGRSKYHFVGEVDVMVAQLNDEQNLEEVKFECFDKKIVEDEVIIQLDREHLSEDKKTRRELIQKELDSENVPFKLIKSNRYIPYRKQLALIDFFRKNILIMERVSFSGNFPKKEVLGEILDICEQYIFDSQDLNRYQPFRGDQLKSLVNFYISKHYVSPKSLIEHPFIQDSTPVTDTRIRRAFQFLSLYCEFKLPKYLRCFQKLYDFVSEEQQLSDMQCSLDVVVLKLEFGTINELEIELRAMGLPSNITKKLAHQSPGDIKNVRQNFNNGDYKSQLNSFENRLVKRYL